MQQNSHESEDALVPSLAGPSSLGGSGAAQAPLVLVVRIELVVGFLPEAREERGLGTAAAVRRGGDAVGGGVALRVGVAVVTFDRPRYLERCLANVAAQTYPAARTEVLVVDDTPGDAARRAVEARTGAPLACSRYVHLPRRASIGAKRQRAATELRDALGCDVIATWDDDDAYGADRLARQVAPIAAGAADNGPGTARASGWRM